MFIFIQSDISDYLALPALFQVTTLEDPVVSDILSM